MINFDNNCCGCLACLSKCPFGAIDIIKDSFGFIGPSINQTKCKECNVCCDACPKNISDSLFNEPHHIYGAINRNVSIQLSSSSSGAFFELAKNVLQKNGVVFGCALDERLNAKHVCVSSLDDLKRLQKSKYIQSQTCGVFSEVREKLDRRVNVLFSGTPCQIAALRAFLRKDYQNLITIDLVCHGVPSNSLFLQFVSFFEKKNNVHVEMIDFRYKIPNVNNFLTKIDYFKAGKKKSKIIPWQETSYGYLFMKGLTYRESCYSCNFAQEKRVSDITLGDFWGGEDLFDKKKISNGISLVMVNTKKGELLFNEISNNFDLIETSIGKAKEKNPQLSHPSKRTKDVDLVYGLMKKDDYREVELQYRRYYKKRFRVRFSFFARKRFRHLFVLLRKIKGFLRGNNCVQT